MAVRAVLVDDEQNNIDNLLHLLQKHCRDVDVVATASSADEAESVINAQNPDLLFLDVQMPGRSGFDLLKALPQSSFEIIFVTAYDHYGIQAVKFSAIDYLLKPINVDELKAAVEKAVIKIGGQRQNRRLENLLHLLQQGRQRDEHRIALPTQKETRFVKTAEIVRCESSNNYTTFYFAGGEKLLVAKPIFEYEELLADYGFIRCHQSHLINRRYVKSWVKEDGGYLLLENGAQVPVSRQRREKVLQQMA